VSASLRRARLRIGVSKRRVRQPLPRVQLVRLRVGQHAASWLAPALEEVLTGRALATSRRGFLAELTAAYYLDEEEDSSGFHEDGKLRVVAHWFLTSESASRTLMNACRVTPSRRAS
jgi:hypothetical protein